MRTKVTTIAIAVVILVTSLVGCSSIPSRDEQFYYGDIYFGMSQTDVYEIATGTLYDKDDTILTYKTTDTPYVSGEHQTMYSFKGGELATIAVWYEHDGSKDSFIKELRTALSNDYGTYTEGVDNYDDSTYYEWKTNLVKIKLMYDDVTERAVVYYFRIVF